MRFLTHLFQALDVFASPLPDVDQLPTPPPSNAPRWRRLEEGELYQPGDEVIAPRLFESCEEDSLQAPSYSGGWIFPTLFPGRRVSSFNDIVSRRKIS